MTRRPLLQVPRPCTGQWDWQLEALCRYLDTDVFFARDNESKPARIRRERAAKEICDDCPVRAKCREFALSTSEPFGVWGGTSEADRRAFAHQPEPERTERRPLRITGQYRSPSMRRSTESVDCAAG
ncbi:WhiB family transcriptional regulator [Rhodococcus sp. NPDC056960]|uniref:WhiB family transcriptional regulator n=1 Tax=Rhodococcus sp. NPDC056960 TaxID=3345982 RepID=UPI0036357F2F